MKNSADLGGCYPPRPSASVDNTLLDLQNIFISYSASFNIKLLNNSYLNCGCRLKWRMIIAVNFQFKQFERSLKKIQGFNGIQTRDLSDTSAMLCQLSYEATHWERGQFVEFISPSLNYFHLLYKHQWNTKWAFPRKLHIFTRNMLSSHVKRSPSLWLHNKSRLWVK